MNPKTHQIEGRACITLEAVAELYSVEVGWLKELVTHGLAGKKLHSEGRSWIEIRHLGRIATAVRLCHRFGLDLDEARGELNAAHRFL